MDEPDPFQSRFDSQQPAEPILLDEPAEHPRLGIMHLLVWITCTAILLAVNRLLQDVDLASRPDEVIVVVVWVMYGIARGAGLGGLVLWIARHRHGVPFPVHPGEWCLACAGIGATLRVLAKLLFLVSFLWRDELSPGGSMEVIVLTLCNLATAIVWLLACRRVQAGLWRFVFLLVFANYALSSLSFCCFWAPYHFGLLGSLSLLRLPVFLVPVLLIAITVGDLRRRRRYPWTHWAGVLTGLWFGLANVMVAVWVVVREIGG